MGGSNGPVGAEQDGVPGTADVEEAAEAAVGERTGRDLDVALSSANEADLAEQAQEVPYDDDEQ